VNAGDYSGALEWLNGLDMWRMKPGFERSELLLKLLGNPHLRYRSIIVAGTNGKGSVAWNLAHCAQSVGLKTGLLTSPHLQTPRERIRFNAGMISEDDFSALVHRIRMLAENSWDEQIERPSYYETAVSAGFKYFADAGCDLVIAEVGLGGRLDTVNELKNYGAVITSIDLDHTEHLGDTLAKIASEKAAVIKGGSCIVGSLADEALAVIEKRCEQTGAVLGKVETHAGADYHSRNRALTFAAAAELLPACATPDNLPAYELPPGRSETIGWGGGFVTLEGAHNPAGARASVDYLSQEGTFDVALAGVKSDKHAAEVIRPLGELANRLILCDIPAAKSCPPEQLATVHPGKSEVIADTSAAIEEFLKRVDEGQRGVVFGSLYLVGALRDSLGLDPC